MYKSKNIDFKIFNIEISISFYFVACVSLMFLLDNGYNALLSLVSILVHELGHIVCLLILGGGIKQINFSLSELNIKANEDMLTNPQKLIVALSGPFVNIILYVIFKGTYSQFAMVNLVIACFQLLPIQSLDGDKALEMMGISKEIRKILTFILAFIFAFIGFYVLIITKYNFSILVISMYLLFLACKKL